MLWIMSSGALREAARSEPTQHVGVMRPELKGNRKSRTVASRSRVKTSSAVKGVNSQLQGSCLCKWPSDQGEVGRGITT
jgi:hypothetical protein